MNDFVPSRPGTQRKRRTSPQLLRPLSHFRLVLPWGRRRTGAATEAAVVIGSPPETAAESLPEVEVVLDPMTEFALRLGDLETAVREFSRRDASGRAAINALHSEIGDYKDGFLVQAQAPMLRALVRLLDGIDEMVEGGKPVTSKDLTWLGDQVVEVLESYGAEEVAERPEVVDGAFQKVIRTVPTVDPAQDRRVADTVRRGWRADGRVLRPQHVYVYKFSELTAEPAAPASEAQEPPAAEASTGPAQEQQSAPSPAETASTMVADSVPPIIQPEPPIAFKISETEAEPAALMPEAQASSAAEASAGPTLEVQSAPEPAETVSTTEVASSPPTLPPETTSDDHGRHDPAVEEESTND